MSSTRSIPTRTQDLAPVRPWASPRSRPIGLDSGAGTAEGPTAEIRDRPFVPECCGEPSEQRRLGQLGQLERLLREPGTRSGVDDVAPLRVRRAGRATVALPVGLPGRLHPK